MNVIYPIKMDMNHSPIDIKTLYLSKWSLFQGFTGIIIEFIEIGIIKSLSIVFFALKIEQSL